MFRPFAPLLLGFALASSTPATAREDVPFITTPDHVALAMLRLANVGPDDYVIDLGSGDGRIVILAARRFRARGLGVEYVADLVRKSRINARRAGVSNLVEFREQDLFETDLSQATVVTLYLLPEVNLRLRPSLLALRPGTRVVSHDWDMGDWKPDRTVRLAVPKKKVGREKSSLVHLWVVPASLAQYWCGTGPLQGASMQFEQRYQKFNARFSHEGSLLAIEGDLDGAELRAGRDGNDLAMTWAEDRLRVTRARGEFAALADALFAPRPSAACP